MGCDWIRNAAAAGGGVRARWSTAEALAESAAGLPGCRVAFCDTLRGVDLVADLER